MWNRWACSYRKTKSRLHWTRCKFKSSRISLTSVFLKCKECTIVQRFTFCQPHRTHHSTPTHSLSFYSQVLVQMNNRAICSARRRDPLPRNLPSRWRVALTAGWSRVRRLPTQCHQVHEYITYQAHTASSLQLVYMVSDNTISEVNVTVSYCRTWWQQGAGEDSRSYLLFDCY